MTTFENIVDDFTFLDDWDDRYKYLIDLGRSLPDYPESARDDAHKVRGCASQVWLTHDLENIDGRVIVNLFADSDAHIVSGLVAILLTLYSGKTPDQILSIDPTETLKPLDLNDHLTPQRSNGLASMITVIRKIAEKNTALA